MSFSDEVSVCRHCIIIQPVAVGGYHMMSMKWKYCLPSVSYLLYDQSSHCASHLFTSLVFWLFSLEVYLRWW